ncbi:transposase [Neobacillus drentensis]|uniref:RNA-guided endonuclease InsQ/TnpB family protein n=1 Tax=Neobacillus drentensis TaxID=220684 RepID=UPI001F36CFB3|nr:transposase [Neobacillus drentensis]ULT59378.1 transposase [Neobacillus drentensis]
MKRAYKTEIELTSNQAEKVTQTIGVCRYVYNLYLERNHELYEKEQKFISGFDFSKWLNNIYTKENDPWIKKVSSKAVKQAIMNGEKAFRNFFEGKAKFPRFKKKKNQDVKAYFPKNNKTDWTIERHRVKIPTLGWIKLKEFGYIPTNFKVISGTVSQKAGRYYVSVLCEVVPKEKTINNNDGIGIDVGIKNFAVCSNADIYRNINLSPRNTKLEKGLKRQQRKLSRKYENKKKGGESCYKNIEKQVKVIQKIHARLTHIRKEYVRDVVTRVVKAKPSYITIEDLNIKGMLKNKHLADRVRKQNFYYFRTCLEQKCKQNGIELRLVGRFFPSSKLCSCCGHKKVSLSLSERIFICDQCGIEIERDFNASLNLRYAMDYTIIT